MQRLGCDYGVISAGGAWSRADGGVSVIGVNGPDGVASGLYSPDGGELIVLGNGFIGHWYRGGICVQGCNDAGQPAGFAPCAVQDFYADCHRSSDGGP